MTRSRIPADILSNGRAFIESIAASNEMREKYGQRPAASKGHVRNAILFGILTANERYEAAERALRSMSEESNANLDDVTTVTLVLRIAGIIFYNDKAHAIAEFIERFEANPTPFHPLPDESCAEYRDRLFLMNIRGLGYVKTSFAAYLAYGGGNVICADRHILNIYTDGNFKDWMHKGNSKKARELQVEVEQHFVGLAAIYEWPSASALQWAVWCEAIGVDTDHSPVTLQGRPRHPDPCNPNREECDGPRESDGTCHCYAHQDVTL